MLNRVSCYLAGLKSLALKVDRGLLLLLALPLFLLLANPSWILTPTGSIDPWVYFGYFRNLGHHLWTFAGTYYGTRLPQIIPGYLCNRLFPPLAAEYVLHLTFYYIAVISLYLILKQCFNSRVALLTSILMGCYPFFLGAQRCQSKRRR